MPRYAVAERSAGAGSTTLPLMSIFAAAAVSLKIREIGVFNTTTTAVAIALRRYTAVGTVGASLTEMPYDKASAAAAGTAVNTHTVTPTFETGNIRVAPLGAAVGAGVIWTFGDTGLVIPVGTGNGIGISVLTGTGQICDVYFDWDE